MTTGHKHRTVRIYEGGRLYRMLRKPLWHTTNFDRVDRSPYPYGQCQYDRPDDPHLPKPDCFYLSSLSILHRWTGLTLETWRS